MTVWLPEKKHFRNLRGGPNYNQNRAVKQSFQLQVNTQVQILEYPLWIIKNPNFEKCVFGWRCCITCHDLYFLAIVYTDRQCLNRNLFRRSERHLQKSETIASSIFRLIKRIFSLDLNSDYRQSGFLALYCVATKSF